MSESDTLRLAARRAALHAAIRQGDARAAARAAARVLVPGARLTTKELALARETRVALGRALVAARLPPPEPLPPQPFAVAPRHIPWKRLLAVVAAVLALVFLTLGPGGAPGGKPEGAPAAAQPAEVTRQQLLLQVSRGRTAPTLAPEFVAAEPSVEPSVAPSAAPTAAPTPSTAAAGAGGAGGAGGSSSGSGAGGGGIGIGSGPGLVTLPTPRPTTTPRFPPPGYGRLTILVLDSRTLSPVPDTCIVFGSPTCVTLTQPGDASTILNYHTNERGRWSLDIPTALPTSIWDMYFIKDGYLIKYQRVTVQRGREVIVQVFITRVV